MLATMRCDPCGKNFTGLICYNQHVESEKHKRKLLSSGCLNASNEANSKATITKAQISQPTLKCSVCQISFDSFSDFQIHSESPEHAQKVLESNSKNNVTAPEVTDSNDVSKFESSIKYENGESDNILPSNDMMIKSQTLTYATCSICSKIFSGPEPYKQHMESAAHKKKVELEKIAASSEMNQNIAPFYCDPCKKIFSGNVPYVQHMESEIHKRKMLTLQLLNKETSEIDSVSGIKESNVDENNQNNPWFCNVCKKQCSGHIPYQQHLNGATHQKNVKRENGKFKPGNSLQFALQNTSNGKDTFNASYAVNGNNLQLNNTNGNMDEDSVFPDMISNLNLSCQVMSTEELERSVTVFLPDTPLNFDESDNKIDSHSENEEIYAVSECEDAQVCETKENSNAYQTCDFCNVNLKSKEEARIHFESKEHFLKRWKSN